MSWWAKTKGQSVKVESVQKFDDQVLELSRSQCSSPTLPFRTLYLFTHSTSPHTIPLHSLYLFTHYTSPPTLPLHTLYLFTHYTSSLTIPLHPLYLSIHSTSPPTLPLPSLYLSTHYTSPHILPIHPSTSPHILPIHPLYLSTHSTSPPSKHFHPLYLSTHFTSPPILPLSLTLHLVYNLVNCLMYDRWDICIFCIYHMVLLFGVSSHSYILYLLQDHSRAWWVRLLFERFIFGIIISVVDIIKRQHKNAFKLINF